jgi:hypothetical protein
MEQEQQATIAGQQGKAVTTALVQESCAMSGQGGTAASAVARIAAPGRDISAIMVGQQSAAAAARQGLIGHQSAKTLRSVKK